MFDFFKNIAQKNSCSMTGACSIHPSLSALYQVILNEIREISFYLVKLKEFKIDDFDALKLCLDGLSVFLINTSFNEEKYLIFLKKLNETSKKIKEIYLNYCKNHDFPNETIDNNFSYEDNFTISQLINYSQMNLMNKQRNLDRTKQRLFELITIFARLCAVEVVKIKKIKPEFNKFDYEIIRFFALTNGYSIRNEKIIRRIIEFSNFALQIKEKLASLYEERYGKKESAQIETSSIEGHCILVSGDDLDNLEMLLKTINEMDIKEKINVYTNSALVLAHFYPYFKNNKFLKGHLDSNNIEYDFSTFAGPILITSNFVQKIDNLYRGEIFSNKLISYSKVIDIKNNDYKPLIDIALKSKKCSEIKAKTLHINYNRKSVQKFISKIEEKEIIIVSGMINENHSIENCKDKKIVKINCPLENDILIDTIKELKAKKIKVVVFFAQCNFANLGMLLSLLAQDVELHIANCSHVLINPHIIESLREDFDVSII